MPDTDFTVLDEFRDGHFHARVDAAPVPRELCRVVAERPGQPAGEAR
jgi:hypothetical protein